jgi:hypothetical protein
MTKRHLIVRLQGWPCAHVKEEICRADREAITGNETYSDLPDPDFKRDTLGESYFRKQLEESQKSEGVGINGFDGWYGIESSES